MVQVDVSSEAVEGLICGRQELIVDEGLPGVADKGVVEFIGGLEELEDVVELFGLGFVGELGLDVLAVFGSHSTLSISK